MIVSTKMATALDTDFEGKRMVSTSDICGACETNIAVKICEECPVNLCATCAKGHQKLKYTADHNLVDIAKTSASSDRTTTGKCPIHQTQQYTTLCKDCIELVCDSCKPGHKDHSLQPLNGDPKLCQKVCSKHIQHLLGELQELEEVRSVLESDIQTFDEATLVVDKWELELIQIVKDKAARLRTEIKSLKDQKYDQLTGKINGLMTKLKEIDESISKLNSIRKSMDFRCLSSELAASQDLISKLDSYKSELQPIPPAIHVDDILPNGDRKSDVQDSVDAMLNMLENTHFGIGPKPVAAWVFNALNKGKDLSKGGKNPVTMTNINYGSGPNGDLNDAAILPTTSNQSMIVQNPTDKLRFTTEMTYYTHIFVEASNEGALFEYTGSQIVCLLYSNKDSLYISISKPQLKTEGAYNVLAKDSWNKIALVLEKQKITMYVNGQLVNTAGGVSDLSSTHSGDIHFGTRPDFGSQCSLKGKIASVRFYDVALTEQEIKNL